MNMRAPSRRRFVLQPIDWLMALAVMLNPRLIRESDPDSGLIESTLKAFEEGDDDF